VCDNEVHPPHLLAVTLKHHLHRLCRSYLMIGNRYLRTPLEGK
jgi:hypothetical protein